MRDMAKHKPIVYIASPYTRGDVGINVHFQCKTFNKLLTDGMVWPVAPLWTHFQHVLFPQPYSKWIEYEQALLSLYDACLRLNAEHESFRYTEAESSGANAEVETFHRLGRPVFYSIPQLYDWVENEHSPR